MKQASKQNSNKNHTTQKHIKTAAKRTLRNNTNQQKYKSIKKHRTIKNAIKALNKKNNTKPEKQ